MPLAYIKLFHTFLDEVEALSMEERGRLLTAMLLHGRRESVPPELLAGNERFLFPRWRMQIDRDNDTYDELCRVNRENGMKGGRPRKDAAPVPSEAPAPNPPKDARPAPKPKIAPTLSDVREYCIQKRLSVVPEEFHEYYEDRDWQVNGVPLFNWRKKLEQWSARNDVKPNPFILPSQRPFPGNETFYTNYSGSP